MIKVKGKGLSDLIDNINDWLDDGRTINKLSLHIDDSEFESHTLYIDETPREIKEVFVDKEVIVDKIIVKEIIVEKEVIVEKEKFVVEKVIVEKEDMSYDEVFELENIQSLNDLAGYLRIDIGEIMDDLGISSSFSLSYIPKSSYSNRRKWGLKLAYEYGLDVNQAIKIMSRPPKWVNENKIVEW